MPRANITCPTSSTSPPRRAAMRSSSRADPYETAGVNSRAELAHLELDWQRRRREQALQDGATLIDPESVWFAHDTKLGRDVTVEPHVVFGPGVEIADGATIKAFSHIEGATIATKADHRSVRPAAPGREDRRESQGRQFRRGEEGGARSPAPRPITCPTSAMPMSARTRTSARARSPAITTGSASTAP